MAPPSKKRSWPASDKANGNNRSKKIKKTNGVKPKTKPNTGKNVRLDELAWKEVSMPDRLDDVEGFFGLEEVDDVEVVREDGAIKFVRLGGDESSEKYEETHDGAENAEDAEDEGEDDGEEWGGIDDKNTTAEPEPESTKESTSPAPAPQKSALKKSKHTATHSDAELSSFSFSLLSEATPEEDFALPAWSTLNLSAPTLRALARLQFTTPTPIQLASIPHILSSSSLIGKASTGSGKTLAFGIPILEKYLSSLPADTKEKPPKDRNLTALIIAPTRELAHQITKHLTELCYYTDLKLVTITGGLSLQKQQRLLDNGVDVIVATPGRLWEIVSEGQGWVEKLRKVKFLVLDEADRVLEEGHFKEVSQILSLMDAEYGDSSDEETDEEDAKEKVFGGAHVEKKAKRKREKQREQSKLKSTSNGSGQKKIKHKRQTLVFSATFSKSLQQKLSSKNSKRNNWSASSNSLLNTSESMEYLLTKLHFSSPPEFIDVSPLHAVAEKVKEGIVECGAMEKDLYLYYLLLKYPTRTLVFTNSISCVKRLVPMLNHLLLTSPSQGNNPPPRVFPLHSQLPQKSRLRSLERFSAPPPPPPNNKNYQPPILIATDVAARGLDIPNVNLVIHYHLPRTADMYVHRSGRTGRTSSSSSTSNHTNPFGSSILLCAPGEATAMARLIGKIHAHSSSTQSNVLQTIDIDRHLLPHLKRRVVLANNLSTAHTTKQKLIKEEDWLRTAADELGVDISDSEIAKISGRDKKGDRSKNKGRSKGGRGEEWDDGGEEGDDNARGNGNGGGGGGVSKEQIEKWKWELKRELGKKINLGFSMRYLTSGAGAGVEGGVNLAEHLLRGEGHGEILGAERREVIDEMMRS